MNKRLFSVLFAMALLVSCLAVGAAPVFAASSATVTVASVSGNVGDIVEVPVSITANSYMVNADMSVTFDPTKLELVEYYENPDDPSEKTYYQANSGIFNNKWMYLGNEKEPGLFMFVAASSGSVGLTKGGEMFRMAFKILNEEADGATIAFSADPIRGNDGNSGVDENGFPLDSGIDLTTVNGTVTVVAGMRGDMNGDGELNMMDALLLYSGISYGSIDSANDYVADYNGDGEANMMDALILYNAVST